MIKLATDEDFNNDILHGLVRENPLLDVVRIQDTPLYGAKDPAVLEWLAQENRVLLKHDVNTMPMHARKRLQSGLATPGIIVVKQLSSVGLAIRDISIVLGVSSEGELEGQMLYLPFPRLSERG